jgi:hypothetical protein
VEVVAHTITIQREQVVQVVAQPVHHLFVTTQQMLEQQILAAAVVVQAVKTVFVLHLVVMEGLVL